ncbi:MAG: GntR family transcriptional regulator [Chloroflexota bacterium]
MLLDSHILPATKSTADLIADTLRNAILQGELEIGQPLRQDQIAADLNVSKIPVREALAQLRKEGLVEIRPNRGAIVSSLSFEEIEEIFAMRLALESVALKKAIPNMTEGDFAGAERILLALDRTDTIKEWINLNWEFHQALYRPSRMFRLLETVTSLNANVTRYVTLSGWWDIDYLAKPQKEHWQILEYCQQQETDLAVTLLEMHLGGPIAHLRKVAADQ